MTLEEQTLYLFLGIGGVLAVATIAGMLLAWRSGPSPVVINLNQRIRAWWVMVILIGIAFLFGRMGVIVLFAFASFTALREFMTLTETRRGDHYALLAAFFIILPYQYYLIAHRLVRALFDLHPRLRLPAHADRRRPSRRYDALHGARGRDAMGADDRRVLRRATCRRC